VSAYAWPTDLQPSGCSLFLEPNVREFINPWTGAYDVVDLMGERWHMTVTLPVRRRSQAGAIEAYFNRLRGVHTATAWYFSRPAPIGTMRGTPILSAQAAQGVQSLSVSGAGAYGTVKAGDMLGLAGQWLQVAADATASAGGAITILTANRVRATVSSSTAVVWDKPTATFRLASPRVPVAHLPGYSDSLDVELIETW